MDLSLSISYMLYRTFGGATDGSMLAVTPALNQYFTVHGIIAVIVIALELAILTTGLMQLRQKTTVRLYRRVAPVLFAVWFLAFISGEVVLIIYYVL